MTTGEAAGLIAPATVGALAADSRALFPLLLATGALEGAMLGPRREWCWRDYRGLRVLAWTALTAARAVVGLALFFVIATPLWQEGQAAPTAISIGIGAGLVMAVAMAVITEVTMCELLKRQP